MDFKDLWWHWVQKAADIFHSEYLISRWVCFACFWYKASWLLEAGREVAVTRSWGQEVRTASSIPLSWNPGSSESTSEGSVQVGVSIYNMAVWVLWGVCGCSLTCGPSKWSEIPSGALEHTVVYLWVLKPGNELAFCHSQLPCLEVNNFMVRCTEEICC